MALYSSLRNTIAATVAGMAIVVASGLATPAVAQSVPALFSDTEVEQTLRTFCTPIWIAAGLKPEDVHLVLVNSPQLNAFVAGGQNIFMYTGTIEKSDNALEVIGVMAHETGHIAGGHLVRIQDELRNATIENILAMIAGIGAGVASGNAGVGAGAMLLGQNVAQRNILKYSRTQEASADQAGMKFLDETHQSSRGMLQFFEKLEGQEFLLSGNQDPYLQTHPLTRDRIDSVEQHVNNSPYSDVKDSAALMEMHQRMLAKLKGYLWPLDQVMQTYPKTDTSQPARYARAIALFRVSRMKEALILMDSLLKETPDDPFFLEQKGQILFQNGRLADALPLYQRASDLRPYEPLLRQELGQVQLETEDQRYVKPAVANLEFAAGMQANDPDVWHLLSIAYGRDNQIAMSQLAQAQEAAAAGDKREARMQAKRALKGLPSGSPAWMQANDIISATGGPEGEDSNE